MAFDETSQADGAGEIPFFFPPPSSSSSAQGSQGIGGPKDIEEARGDGFQTALISPPATFILSPLPSFFPGGIASSLSFLCSRRPHRFWVSQLPVLYFRLTTLAPPKHPVSQSRSSQISLSPLTTVSWPFYGLYSPGGPSFCSVKA